MFRVLLKMSVDELHSPLKLMDMPDKSEKKNVALINCGSKCWVTLERLSVIQVGEVTRLQSIQFIRLLGFLLAVQQVTFIIELNMIAKMF